MTDILRKTLVAAAALGLLSAAACSKPADKAADAAAEANTSADAAATAANNATDAAANAGAAATDANKGVKLLWDGLR